MMMMCRLVVSVVARKTRARTHKEMFSMDMFFRYSFGR